MKLLTSKLKFYNNFSVQRFSFSVQKGVTLIEMLVAVTVFAITVGAISGIFISGIRTQRRILATQELLDQTSYVMEYAGRALRMAKKELSDPATCLTTVGRGYNYESLASDRIRFLNYENKCQEFYQDGSVLKERKSTDNSELNFGSPSPLTSTKLNVNVLRFNLSGAAQPTSTDCSVTDCLQPRVTIFLEIEGRETGVGRPKIQIQTSISQRDLDIQY
jgi:prepilin-type N-terminal cleavage/methylation domain-containing protein